MAPFAHGPRNDRNEKLFAALTALELLNLSLKLPDNLDV